MLSLFNWQPKGTLPCIPARLGLIRLWSKVFHRLVSLRNHLPYTYKVLKSQVIWLCLRRNYAMHITASGAFYMQGKHPFYGLAQKCQFPPKGLSENPSENLRSFIPYARRF